MKISFLVPVYNVKKYITKCLESLLLQKGCSYEIVLLDDGSTDGSAEICDDYAAQYSEIIRVIHKENEGLLQTRRRGFKEARGEWSICVDSDDYVAPNLLETIVEAIEKHDCDMVMYNYEYVDDAGNHTSSRVDLIGNTVFEGSSKIDLYEKKLLSVNINTMWMRAVRNDIVDKDNEYKDCGIRNMCEDAVQVLALYSNANRIVYIDAPLYFYRKGTDSITTSRNSFERWKASKACFNYTEKYLDIWNISGEVRSRFYTQHLEFLSNYVRWLMSCEEEEIPYSLSEMIHRLNEDSSFKSSKKAYRKKFAKTVYLAFSVPIIMKYVETENVKALKRFFCFERVVRRIKCVRKL